MAGLSFDDIKAALIKGGAKSRNVDGLAQTLYKSPHRGLWSADDLANHVEQASKKAMMPGGADRRIANAVTTLAKDGLTDAHVAKIETHVLNGRTASLTGTWQRTLDREVSSVVSEIRTANTKLANAFESLAAKTAELVEAQEKGGRKVKRLEKSVAALSHPVVDAVERVNRATHNVPGFSAHKSQDLFKGASELAGAVKVSSWVSWIAKSDAVEAMRHGKGFAISDVSAVKAGIGLLTFTGLLYAASNALGENPQQRGK